MATQTAAAGPARTDWPAQIPADEWRLYREAIDSVHEAGGRFLLGGAFGLAAYTGRWRNTKDLDLYVLPEERPLVVEALGRAGFRDYYTVLPYDRKWIHRTTRDGVIVDVIWAMANGRAEVDELWFQRAAPLAVRDVVLAAIPPEELIWTKLYVVQRDRCDWPDVLNLIAAAGTQLDWEHLLRRIGEDAPLLTAAMTAFGWLWPDRMHELPLPRELAEAVAACATAAPSAGPMQDGLLRRAALLDTRPWFVPAIPH